MLLVLAACSQGSGADQDKAKKAPPLVSVTETKAVDIPVDLPAQGHIVALDFVDVRPQVGGTVVGVHFHEGEQIANGQLLFTIDDSDARAQLAKAEAQTGLVQSQLADARREHGRAEQLVKAKFIAVSAVDTAASKVDGLEAQARAARAEADSARTTLKRTRIVAPISGRAGAVVVHPGSLVQAAAAAPLVTIAQFSPIGVEFNLPEQDLPALLAARAAGPVAVSIDGHPGATGQLSFVNNTINQDSATISLKASFPNPDQTMWPGGFARVVVHAGVSHGAVVLPPQAVQDGPGGRFVYLVGPNNKVSSKPVRLLRIQDEAAVVDGIAGGQRVVLEGGQNLRPGMTVQLAKDAGTAGAR
ncbi:efflux RND transporter periplasmic adaptor subunit [Massilia aerilata]|uniref:Efflux RND transporter periplasmic adaptor subunit n=1 Tax=Massilia aerilata TaxID=453817 RepID=A0ABW0RY82_9BURK